MKSFKEYKEKLEEQADLPGSQSFFALYAPLGGGEYAIELFTQKQFALQKAKTVPGAKVTMSMVTQ